MLLPRGNERPYRGLEGRGLRRRATLPITKSGPTLWASRDKHLDPLGEPDQPRIGKPEIGEGARGAGEIIAVGAAATGRACNDLCSLFQRQPPGVVWVITPYREGKCRHAAASSPHRQPPHIVNPGRCHLARPQGIDRL